MTSFQMSDNISKYIATPWMWIIPAELRSLTLCSQNRHGPPFNRQHCLMHFVLNKLWHFNPNITTYRSWGVTHSHDGVIKWKHFPRYWPFVRGIHRSTVNSPHKGQWRGALMFFYLGLNKRLIKQSWGWWFETQSCPLWRHSNEIKLSWCTGGKLLPEPRRPSLLTLTSVTRLQWVKALSRRDTGSSHSHYTILLSGEIRPSWVNAKSYRWVILDKIE